MTPRPETSTQTTTVGSLGFKIASVAEGAMDLYLTTTDKTYLWDICAGDIILQEAGGEMVDLRGQPFVYKGRRAREMESRAFTSPSRGAYMGFGSYEKQRLRNECGIIVSNGRLTSPALAVVERLNETGES